MTKVAWVAVALACAGCGEDGGQPQTADPPRPFPVLARQGPFDDLAFDAEGGLLASRDGTLYRVERSGRLRAARRLAGFAAVALAPGAQFVAEFHEEHRSFLRVRRGTAGRPLFRVAVPRSAFESPRAMWSHDGRRIVIPTEGRPSLRVLDARDGRLLRTLHSSGYLGRQPLSPDGRRLVLGGGRGAVLVDVATGARTTLPVRGGMDRPAWSPNGQRIAGDARGSLVVVDIRTGQTRRLGSVGAVEVAWSPDGRQVAAYGGVRDGDWRVTVFDAATGRATVVDRFPFGEERAELAWSSDGRHLAYQVGRPL